MNSYLFPVFFFTLMVVIAFIGIYKKYKKFRDELSLRKGILTMSHREVQKANSDFKQLTSFESGYLSNKYLHLWLLEYTHLFEKFKSFSLENLDKFKIELRTLIEFKETFKNAKNLRSEYNKTFLQNELIEYKDFFNEIEGRKLDEQQRRAIIVDEDNNLVIAGAGSGKTTTIIGKVKYLIKKHKLDASQIALISFTNKAAETLNERVGNDSCKATTIHKLGISIITKVEGKKPSVYDVAKFLPFLLKTFDELILNKVFLEDLNKYTLDFSKESKTPHEFKTQGSYFEFLKENDFRPYKLIEIHTHGKITFGRESVKSIEECKIANFLYLNGIEYLYESPYEVDTSNENYGKYKPDFTILHNGKKIYLEHFGIDSSGNVPSWFKGVGDISANQHYKNGMEWKRDQHKENGTILIESYSHEMSSKTLLPNLELKLKRLGVEFKSRTPQEIWNLITSSDPQEKKAFLDLISTFIVLLKSNQLKISDIKYKNRNTPSLFFKARTDLFLKIIEPVFNKYQNMLDEIDEIDFSDMIVKATNYIKSKVYVNPFRYIIVDEFQDTSMDRYHLLNELKNSNPYCKLFCVGDDWQSIYRFAGSDITLFKNFESFFGFSATTKIETTYRFGYPLIDDTSKFVLKNPNQSRKELKFSGTTETNYKIIYSATDDKDDTLALKQVFEDIIVNYENYEKASILILGRYKHDINRINKNQNTFKIENKNSQDKNAIISLKLIDSSQREVTLSAEFMTVHKAKGLEADIVIILNCNAGKYGFPSGVSDDFVLNFVLSESDQFENGEERRLFYVAMTRARKKLYLISEATRKSKFITELEANQNNLEYLKTICPLCETNSMVLRGTGTETNGRRFRFFGCSNFQLGCTYKFKETIEG